MHFTLINRLTGYTKLTVYVTQLELFHGNELHCMKLLTFVNWASVFLPYWFCITGSVYHLCWYKASLGNMFTTMSSIYITLLCLNVDQLSFLTIMPNMIHLPLNKKKTKRKNYNGAKYVMKMVSDRHWVENSIDHAGGLSDALGPMFHGWLSRIHNTANTVIYYGNDKGRSMTYFVQISEDWSYKHTRDGQISF